MTDEPKPKSEKPKTGWAQINRSPPLDLTNVVQKSTLAAFALKNWYIPVGSVVVLLSIRAGIGNNLKPLFENIEAFFGKDEDECDEQIADFCRDFERDFQTEHGLDEVHVTGNTNSDFSMTDFGDFLTNIPLTVETVALAALGLAAIAAVMYGLKQLPKMASAVSNKSQMAPKPAFG